MSSSLISSEKDLLLKPEYTSSVDMTATISAPILYYSQCYSIIACILYYHGVFYQLYLPYCNSFMAIRLYHKRIKSIPKPILILSNVADTNYDTFSYTFNHLPILAADSRQQEVTLPWSIVSWILIQIKEWNGDNVELQYYGTVHLLMAKL